MAAPAIVDQKFSAIAQTLWDLDKNRVVGLSDYELNLQKGIIRFDGCIDRCEEPLFSFVKEDKLMKISTFQSFIKLLDNYVTSTGHNEVITQEEINEQNHFLDECLKTDVLKKAHEYLVAEGKVSKNIQDFKKLLWDLWFKMYSRVARSNIMDSCAFEHVFVGEKNTEGALGCHNWLQYYLLEKKHSIDYFGYVPKQCQPTRSYDQPQLLAVQFSMEGSIKEIGSFLVGVSPEFEIALYTLIALCKNDELTPTYFANMKVTFHCFKMQRNNRQVLSTVYPSKY